MAIDKIDVTKGITGVLPTANLGSGTASSSKILYGDQTYKTAPSAGLTKIDSSVASGAVSTLTFSTFSDTYQNYLIQGTLSVDTTSADLVFKFNKSSGVEGGSNYWNAIAASYVDSSGTGCNYNRSVHSSNRMELCRDMVTDAARGVAFNIWCIDFRSTTKRASVIYQSCNMLNNDSFENITGTAMYNSSTTDVYNGIQFYPSSGNIDVREIYVYGVAK